MTSNCRCQYYSWLEAPLDLEALGLSLHSLLVNPAPETSKGLSLHSLLVNPAPETSKIQSKESLQDIHISNRTGQNMATQYLVSCTCTSCLIQQLCIKPVFHQEHFFRM